jgi:hypothetical protein
MPRNPVHAKDGQQKDEPVTKGNAHKPAKHIEEIARLASSVEPDKDPARVRIARDRSEQP